MKNRNRFFKLCILIGVAALLVVGGCKKDTGGTGTINYQYNYYPIDSGHFIIYNVDSVTFGYDQIHYTRDTASYQMQAFFGDTIHDLLDSVNFRVYYSTRANSNANWGTPYGTYGLRTLTTMQVVENDLRFIKMVFPPQQSATWQGNLYIGDLPGDPNDPYKVFQGWTYNYQNCDTTVIIAGQTYNHVIVVNEVNNTNAISKTVRTEMYAPNVGMIYQEWEALQNNANLSLGWDTGATSGFSIHMWAIAHNP